MYKGLVTRTRFLTYLNSCKGVKVVEYGGGLSEVFINGKRTFIEPMLAGVRFPDDRYIRYTSIDALSKALLEAAPAFVKRTYKEFLNEN